MNISTGGPHILLFERDQQLAALLTSELQLAGYECHTARTAVEVFDAIARFPVRLVLVNLAQAAAARREFWVALDTQRRGSGVQVYTFHCANLAGYGPRDPDDQGQTTLADMEVDGMLGLMNLVDAVRARVPDVEGMVSTLPRMPRAVPNSPNATVPIAAQRPVQTPASTQPVPPATNGTLYRTSPLNQHSGNQQFSMTGRSHQQPSQPLQAPAYSAPQAQIPNPVAQAVPAPVQQEPANNGQGGFQGEKIRAVLYPTQRAWSSGTNSAPNWQDTRTIQDTPMTYAPQGSSNAVPSTPSDSMLQRLANGQLNPNESGLEQLSRLAHGQATPARREHNQIMYQPPESVPPPGAYPAATPTYTQPHPVIDSATTYVPPARAIQFSEHTSPLYTASPVAQMRPAPVETAMNTQPMRPAPIQDLPLERTIGTEGPRRLDVLARANYGQQTSAQTAPQTPLASITTAAAAPPPPVPVPATPVVNTATPTFTTGSLPVTPAGNNVPTQETSFPPAAPITATPPPQASKDEERNKKAEKVESEGREVLEDLPLDHNAVILNILQSLPPMPNSTAQSIQAQVLNGRATRSLGSVLLDGHLVPQDRLEVAQNIQRMLRGVDLNYQLGDILLMFKLLTPDQLLAASLVSFGLISTTQISALGRIRQELHAIGLEYDLENLVILFRMLTPEQLREVRSNVQN